MPLYNGQPDDINFSKYAKMQLNSIYPRTYHQYVEFYNEHKAQQITESARIALRNILDRID